MMTGVEMIEVERVRQITREGWTAEHDDEHVNGELGAAARAYLYQVDAMLNPTPGTNLLGYENSPPQLSWPWDASWWKPDLHDPIRNLVKAGALIAAEIDRLQRAQS